MPDTVARCGETTAGMYASTVDLVDIATGWIEQGAVFLNHHLLRHFTERKQPASFTRSRAYHKDDNAHIEQKNWTHVRQWLGHEPFDGPHLFVLREIMEAKLKKSSL